MKHTQASVVDEAHTGQRAHFLPPWSSLGAPRDSSHTLTVVATESSPLLNAERSLDMFDRLSKVEPPIVRSNGEIVRCVEEHREGFTVSDALRTLLLSSEESDDAALFSVAERHTLLFRLFELLCLGGGCCQFEVRCMNDDARQT